MTFVRFPLSRICNSSSLHNVSDVGICRELESKFSTGIQQGLQAHAGDTHDPLYAPSGAQMYIYYLVARLKSRRHVWLMKFISSPGPRMSSPPS